MITRRTSDLVPPVLNDLFSHSCLSSARVRDVYKGGLSKLGVTCAEKAPVMCRRRRGGRFAGEEGYCCARARRGRNDVDRGAAISIC